MQKMSRPDCLWAKLLKNAYDFSLSIRKSDKRIFFLTGKNPSLHFRSSVTQKGQKSACVAKAKAKLAYVPDEPLLYSKLTPLEYLEFVAGLWGISSQKAAKLANQLIDELGFSDDSNKYCEVLYKGGKQKLSIAGAFIHEPEIVILDEPLIGLDVVAAKKVKDKLKQYVDDGNTVVMTTHIMEIAEQMAERIGIIHNGQLIAEGTFDELKTKSNQEGGTLESILLELTQNQVTNTENSVILR